MRIRFAAGLVLAAMGWAGVAHGALITCMDTSRNYMVASGAQACLASGVGNLGGGRNDDFLDLGTGYQFVSGASSTGIPDGTSGRASLPASIWDNWEHVAFGFKFGTGNTPDEWFVFKLVDEITSFSWDFFGTLIRGQGTGGLSGVYLYVKGPTTGVPEPEGLALLSMGLLGFAFSYRARRRRTSK